MSGDAPREDVRAWPPTEEGDSSRSGDSFLRELLQVEPSSRLPVPGQWLGGPEGRRFKLLERLTNQAIELSSERGFKVWHMQSSVFRGWALSELGQPREGLALMGQHAALWRMAGLRTGVPAQLHLLAEGRLKLGQVREALAAVQEGLRLSAVTQEHIVDSALHQLWGECLRRLGRRQEAKYCFLRALAIARQQGAGLFELRATMGLCRLLAELGRPEAARRMLERACHLFEAGGECVDLQEARELLASLSTAEVRALP